MAKQIINIDELQFQEFPGQMSESARKKYGGTTMGFVGRLIGAKQLGYNVTVIPPGKGKAAFQFHNHRVNEEAFFILEGEGECRIGAETYPVKKGDCIAHPAGGPETAHQIRNTSDTTPLKYLAISTLFPAEVAEYPDTRKFGILGRFTTADGAEESWRFVGRPENGVDYFDGE